MTWSYKAVPAVTLVVLLTVPPQALLAQQSSFQTSFLSSSSVRLPTSIVPNIVESEHLPYIRQVAKDRLIVLAAFKPNPSDLLIQQAEERFASGRKFYQDGDFDRARTEFNAVIDLMLQDSSMLANGFGPFAFCTCIHVFHGDRPRSRRNRRISRHNKQPSKEFENCVKLLAIFLAVLDNRQLQGNTHLGAASPTPGALRSVSRKRSITSLYFRAWDLNFAG